MKRNYPTHCLALVLWLVLRAMGMAQTGEVDPVEIRPIDPPCPTLRVADITEETERHALHLVFPTWLDIDPARLGDDDLSVFGPDGTQIGAAFESFSHEPIALPLALSSLPDVNAEGVVPQPEPVLVARYSIETPTTNGIYRVQLNADAIANSAGRFLPAKFLGGFRVAISPDPLDPIQPTRTDIDFRRLLGADGETVQYLADVTLTFNTPHVRIGWGELEQDRNTFLANISAVKLPLPEPIPLPVITADEQAARPAGTPLPVDLIAPPHQPQFRFTYRLGALDAGTYRFIARVNEVVEGSNSFTIPVDPPVDLEGPKAELVVRNITRANSSPQQLVVTYGDPSGIDLRTLDGRDLLVFSPCAGHPDIAGIPCPSNWKAQHPRLINVIPLDRRLTRVKAVYELEAPDGRWSARNNGFYPVVWQRGQVCDQLENCNVYQRLGGFEVSIDAGEPPIEAEAEIRVDASDNSAVVAKVHIDFRVAHTITHQSIRRDGNRIYLIAEAEMDPINILIDPPARGQVDLRYNIGPLRRGEYIAAFVMNGHLYDREEFVVDPTPPIDARVDLTILDGTARVSIQFNTPHRVHQGEVTRDGSRVILSARAEPLPIPADAAVILPIPAPVVLEYDLGDLPPGGYLAAFVMNEFPYATQDFVIEDPGPPIPAVVEVTTEQSATGKTFGVVKIEFETPHAIVGKDLHRSENHFIFEARAVPINTLSADVAGLVPTSRIVTLRYPLGDLPGGTYSAAFIMNGYPYARHHWTERDDRFRADVRMDVSMTDLGNWIAQVKIEFEDPQVRITDPGEVSLKGAIIMINATAEVTDALDVPAPFEHTYDLGQLNAGPKWLKFFINDHKEAQEDFVVPAIPARVDLAFDTSGSPDLGLVTIQFRDHYRIESQHLIRLGNLLILVAEADGPLPILAPLPPEPISLTYDLGDLPRGSYHGVFVMNGHLYAHETFDVTGAGFEAEVELSVDTAEENTTLTAVVDIDDPYVLVTDPGTPQIVGNRIHINATAERVVFIVPPSGDPQTLSYDLGDLDAGNYLVTYSINDQPEARLHFTIDPDCRVLPHVASIRTGEDTFKWFSKVALALFPGQEVIDWGTLRQSGNEFHVNVTVACVDHPSPVLLDPVLAKDLPEGFEIDASGNRLIAGAPVRLVSHLYRLGELSSGHYKFCVHSRGETLACHRFQVNGDPPRVELNVANITEEKDEHRIRIDFNDPTGLDIDSIRDAKVWITGPDNYREEATQETFFSTDDEPTSSAGGVYVVNGPEGSWDRPDNGGYRVFIEADKVRDDQGNAIEESLLGGFKVRILPPPNPGVNVSVAMDASGSWQATVEIVSEPGQQVVVNSWGPLVLHGHSFIALASVEIDEVAGPVEPVAHTYDLGQLQPGYYVFAFKSDLAHCGVAGFTVPGVESDPLVRWAARLGDVSDGSAERDLESYFFALHPNARNLPLLGAELVRDAEGKAHLGLRYRRLTGADGIRQTIQGSRRLGTWEDLTDSVDIVERTLDIDGTEIVLVCLRQPMDESNIHYLRIHLAEDE